MDKLEDEDGRWDASGHPGAVTFDTYDRTPNPSPSLVCEPIKRWHAGETDPAELEWKGRRFGDPRFHALLDEIRFLHERKCADYGRDEDHLANLKGSEEWGVPAWKGTLIRLGDKVHRLKSFCSNGNLANEGVEDSLLDLASYS